MAIFYCIYNSVATDSLDVDARITSLKKACIKFKIEFILVDEASFDFSNFPVPTEEDGVYNCARGSYLTEILLISRKVKTFYREFPFYSQKDDSNFIGIQLEKCKIPMPKTIFKGSNNKLLLKHYLEYLGGFPIVIKTYGGTGGLGVIKVNDIVTLFSITDYLVLEKKEFQLKEFIPSKSCERVTVLGSEVIYTISRPIKNDDFRSDGYSKMAHQINLPDEINQVAIRATHAANLNYAGIDLIISDKDGKPYILEVNCPHNFAQHERLTNESYSERMIEWLFLKRKM